MNQQTSGTALRIGFGVLGVIFLVLLVFLLITWIQGDPTNDLEERQPTPSASPS
jgi:hypothetical protein